MEYHEVTSSEYVPATSFSDRKKTEKNKIPVKKGPKLEEKPEFLGTMDRR
jgi:hypothetical protein